jgi:hypothetical protein
MIKNNTRTRFTKKREYKVDENCSEKTKQDMRDLQKMMEEQDERSKRLWNQNRQVT